MKEAIDKHYDPSKVESRWYKIWKQEAVFQSSIDTDKEPYTILLPPPNVTGVLHIGHLLNSTIQDVLIRKARMDGKNACWVPGLDHASIATESKVVARLAEKGISKDSLSRTEFLSHAFAWKEEHGGIILKQLERLGASCDWDRTTFTMDKEYYQAVVDTFVDLYKKGMIYRGERMVNWDPVAQTALSDEEVYHDDTMANMYYIEYPIVGSDRSLTIATTRPETVFGDTAVCIHPEDDRFQVKQGDKVRVPLCDREIPIIFDSYVDRELGTGCLKVTPAHDFNDFELGQKHQLPFLDIFNDDATLNSNAGSFSGLNREEARVAVIKALKKEGILSKIEQIQHAVGRSERTKSVVEPKISTQWFCKTQDLAKPALDAVLDDTVEFFPKNQKNTYRHWMENIRDWCISRQLWWGQQIPAYYYGEGTLDVVVASSPEEALEEVRKKEGFEDASLSDLHQDPDVLDTWFSSWLWPMSVFSKEEKEYYYPSNVVVTGPDIIFFWIARMVMAGYEYEGSKPFHSVYFTGLIRDGQGRKMSKSLGNSPDAIALLDRYGADAVRSGLMLSSPAGNDLRFESKELADGKVEYPLCVQGRNFCNKIWNALRLFQSWEVADIDTPSSNTWALEWFESNLNASNKEILKHFESYRISDALMSVYTVFWSDFCSSYLESIKPEYGQPLDRKTHEATAHFFDQLLRLLHPFMPFITEEVWHILTGNSSTQILGLQSWPNAGKVSSNTMDQAKNTFELIRILRSTRQKQGMSPKEALTIYCRKSHTDFIVKELVSKLANVVWEFGEDTFSDATLLQVFALDFYTKVEVKATAEDLIKEQKRLKGFLTGIEKKLSNDRFVANAPEAIILKEKKKAEDALKKIEAIEAQIQQLG